MKQKKLTTEELFPGIIGQVKAKRRLKFYHDGYTANGIVPHLMFVAPKGCGKTTMARAIAKNLTSREDSSKCKRYHEINCSTIKNVNQYFNHIIIPHVNQKECTILHDECSELPKDVTMALLTILNPNKENRNTFSCEDYTVDFDFRRQSFMFATTEAQSIFHALMDRCERIDLEEYTYEELGRIVSLVTEGADFEDGLLKEIATVLRGNARQAQKMANNIISYLDSYDKKEFSFVDWEKLSYHLCLAPLGLSPIEITVLRYLSEQKSCSLTYLSAKTNLTKACLQKDFEMYLMKHNLMKITRKGREITQKGIKYLEQLKDHEKADKKREGDTLIHKSLPAKTLTK
tara:strand:+ start:791 stop:1828 length:1038 start_codon:yes stop_codon:yes gene_type:complete